MALTLAVIAAFGASFARNGSHCRHFAWLDGHCRHFAWLDGLSTVSVDSLHSTLKVVTRPLDTNHKKAAFKDNEN